MLTKTNHHPTLNLAEFSRLVFVYLETAYPEMRPLPISPGQVSLQVDGAHRLIWHLARLHRQFSRGPQNAARLHSMIEQALSRLRRKPVPLSPDDVLFQVFPRIVRMPEELLPVFPTRPLPAGLTAVLAVDLPDRILYPAKDRLASWDVSEEQLWTHAYRNLSERVFPPARWIWNLGVWVFEGEPFIPSLVFAPWKLKRYLDRINRPVLVGMPDHETLVLVGENDIRMPIITGLIREYAHQHPDGLMSELLPLSAFDILSSLPTPG